MATFAIWPWGEPCGVAGKSPESELGIAASASSRPVGRTRPGNRTVVPAAQHPTGKRKDLVNPMLVLHSFQGRRTNSFSYNSLEGNCRAAQFAQRKQSSLAQGDGCSAEETQPCLSSQHCRSHAEPNPNPHRDNLWREISMLQSSSRLPLPSCSFNLGTTDRENHQQLNDGWAKPLCISDDHYPEADGGDSGPKLILLEWHVRNAGGFLLPSERVGWQGQDGGDKF